MSAARRLPQVCVAMDAADYRAWLNRAAPGDRFRYAEGPELPRARDVVRLVQADAQAGRVHCVTRRRPDGGFDFLVEMGSAAGAPLAGPEAPARLDDEARRLLAFLSARVASGEPLCPSYQDLALELRFHDRQRARYLLRQLEAAGCLTLVAEGTRGLRRVVLRSVAP